MLKLKFKIKNKLKTKNIVRIFSLTNSNYNSLNIRSIDHNKRIPKPVWAVGFALEQTLRDATLAVFSFLILKRLQHNNIVHLTSIKLYCILNPVWAVGFAHTGFSIKIMLPFTCNNCVYLKSFFANLIFNLIFQTKQPQ
ncbi:MAG: hypothetical protein LBH59_05475 [Planctomycetaceae bacterium]|nr:hypothetical protein [Planctomycetaceae bacterium]